MPSRRYIVKNKLERYPVEERIPQILDELSFREEHSQLERWKLFDRKGGRSDPSEFAGLYEADNSKNGFLVMGLYNNIDWPKRDLEAIGNVLNEGKVSKFCRKQPVDKLMTSLLTTMGLVTADLYMNDGNVFKGAIEYLKINITPDFDAAATVGLLTIPAGILVIAGPCSVAGGLLNLHYSSKLSEGAEFYLYGRNAEKRFISEWTWDRIKKEKLTKKEFLNDFELKEI